MTLTPLLTTTGGSLFVGVLVFVGQTLAFLLASWIVVRAYRGYQRTSAPALLWLAIGVALLSAAPTVARFLLPTLTDLPSVTVQVVATSGEIAGLLAILYSIFGNP
jgi:hypothetical protein